MNVDRDTMEALSGPILGAEIEEVNIVTDPVIDIHFHVFHPPSGRRWVYSTNQDKLWELAQP